MIDLEWLKAQSIPPWALHIATEVHAVQSHLAASELAATVGHVLGIDQNPIVLAAATVAPTSEAPADPPADREPLAGTVIDAPEAEFDPELGTIRPPRRSRNT